MLWSGRITLMIMINAIVLTHSSTDEEPIRKLRSTFSPPLVAERQAEGNYVRHFKSRNNSRSKHRLKCDKNWDVEPIIVKLKVVFDKYDLNWTKLRALYAPVKPCVPDKCGNTHHVIPKNLLPKGFKCAKFKAHKRLKKKILKILPVFHSGVQYFFERFQNLISLLERKRKTSGSRMRILKEFENDLKMLNIEVETVVTKKRLKFSRQQQRFGTALPPPAGSFITNHTYFLINEWMILQESKKFLHVWKENLSNVFKCWQEMIFRRGC